MLYEIIPLSVPDADGAAELAAYVPDVTPELGEDRLRTAVIVCPGGGYHRRSDREGEPVAMRFAGMGYAAFLLNYHVAPQGRWPVPQRQLLAAIAHVRTNCRRYHVDPAAIVTMGFSAGGHLACCSGTLWNRQELYRPLRRRPSLFRPDGVVLCYPVVTSGPFAHQGSIDNLLGDRRGELEKLVSLEKRVSRNSPPFFIWHTADDTCVPVENSLLLEKALRAKEVDVELRIYPHGIHGQSLADHTVYSLKDQWMVSPSCAIWVQHCDAWLQRHFGQHPAPGEWPAGKE